MPEDRLAAQLSFLAEADRLKGVLRMTRIRSGERRENSAEHSWHLALMALVLAEHSAEPVDVSRVLGMVVVHDLVEIDAGDTWAYDVAGRETQKEREARAADRIFGILPPEQAARFRALWDEFEAGETPEAKFAASLDFLSAVLPNAHHEGGTWREHGISVERIVVRNGLITDGSPALWAHAEGLIVAAEAAGHVRREAEADVE